MIEIKLKIKNSYYIKKKIKNNKKDYNYFI